MLILNAQVHTVSGPVFSPGFVHMRDGLILSAGPMSELPEELGDEPRFDAGGGFLFPGFIDAHCHLGLPEEDSSSEASLYGGDDPVSPHHRALDAINPKDPGFSEALSAGVTAVCVSPGGGRPIAGQSVALSTSGSRVDDMVIREDAGMKFTLGENPKSPGGGKPAAIIATVGRIRENLMRAAEYLSRKEAYLRASGDDDGEVLPEWDMKMESLLPVVDSDTQARFHVRRADDVFTALRIAKEFELEAVLVHADEAPLAAEALADEHLCVLLTPSQGTVSGAPEFESAAALHRAGVLTAMATDHPKTPVSRLRSLAILAAKAGMEREAAIRAITLSAAECAGIAEIAGSIEPEKRADLVLLDRHPLDEEARVSAVFLGGEQVR